MTGMSGDGRLLGVDLARFLALAGMMAVHTLPPQSADGSTSLAFVLFSGRAAALFAVLAGVGLALATGGRRPLRGRRLAASMVALPARAAVLLAVGLVLVDLGPPVAVILPYYAVLFVVAVPLLALPWWALLPLLAGAVTVLPLVSHVLRAVLQLPGPGQQPGLAALASPGELLTTLVLTGYYPVLAWTAYLLAGLVVGRMDLREHGTAARLLGAGVGLAVAAKICSFALLHLMGGYERLAASVPAGSTVARVGLDVSLEQSFYGTTPTTSWWWLAVSAPHSSTPLDLVHTIGTSVAVLGACLLLATAAASRQWTGMLHPWVAAGSMPLTLYSLHVLALATGLGLVGAAGALTGGGARMVLLGVHVTAAVALATGWRAGFGRGPLEEAAAAAGRSAARLVLPPAR